MSRARLAALGLCEITPTTPWLHLGRGRLTDADHVAAGDRLRSISHLHRVQADYAPKMKRGFAEWLGALTVIASGVGLWVAAAVATRPDWAPGWSGWALTAFGIILALGGVVWLGRLIWPASIFEADVARLRAHSSRVLADMTAHEALIVSGVRVGIEREVAAVAHEVALGGPLLLVGDAGSGKSAVLSGLARRLQQDGADVIAFDADSVAGGSVADLSRELRLDHDLTDVLGGWPNRSRRRYLLVDGLDQTRGVPGVPTLRNLIARTSGGCAWTAIVAVRRFDLRYSAQLRASFAGSTGQPDWADDEFEDVRHVAVGDLSDREVKQLEPLAPDLAAMASLGGVGELLRRPIHLQLAADVLARGAKADVARLRTRVQLLDMYWARLVEEPIGRRGANEAVMRAACDLVIADRRLSFPRATLDDVDVDATTDLLGRGVLVEERVQPAAGRRVRFFHAVVADYTIARLRLLPNGSAQTLLTADPVNALFLRRAVELWLTGLWEGSESKTDFWATALELCDREDVPEIVKLIAPAIATQSWTAMKDLDPLIAALGDKNRVPALVALRHLIAGLTSQPSRPVAGIEASPWSKLCVLLAFGIAEDLVFPTRLLISLLTDARSALTDDELRDLGDASRRLLTWLWDSDSADTFAARSAIRGVCVSLVSNLPASLAVLRRGLCRRHVERRGYHELHDYADNVEDLEATPDLVVALFTATFAFDDASNDQPGVNLGGPVLSLVSDRKQEFRMARYALARSYTGLMNRAPELATTAMLRVLRTSARRGSIHYPRGHYETFATSGVKVRVRDVWSAESVAWISPPDDAATIIEEWSAGLATLAGTDPAKFSLVLSAFLSSAQTFAGWRVLIDATVRHDSLTPSVVGLVSSAPPILSAPTLRDSLCRLARSVGTTPDLAKQLRIGLDSGQVASDGRAALLVCLDGSSGGPDRDHSGESASVALVADSRDISRAVSTLEQWLDSAHEPKEMVPASVWSEFVDLTSSLSAHDSDHEVNWRLAAQAGERLSRTYPDCGTENGQLLAATLWRVLESTAGLPDASLEGDDSFQTIPTHSCVLEAIVGLARMRGTGFCDDELPDRSFEVVADHPLPWARAQLVRASELLVHEHPDLTWSLLGRLTGDKASHVAADAVVMATRFRSLNSANALAILDRMSSSSRPQSKLVSEATVSLAGCLVLDGVEGIDRFETILESAERVTFATPFIHSLRSLITPPLETHELGTTEAHEGAMQLVRCASSIAVKRYDQNFASWQANQDDAAREQFVDAVRLLDTVIAEVYFASGTFKGGGDELRPSALQTTALFDESVDDIRRLLPYLPASAIHHVVEFAAATTDARPIEAFLLIGAAVRAARAVGYESDSLARDLVLGIVRSYMADRTELFQGSRQQAREMQLALIAILDSFVAVGWPEARAMAYHLSELLE